jgi:hypothetical protein
MANRCLAASTIVLLTILVTTGCTTRESLSEKYRSSVIAKLKEIQALDLSAEVVPPGPQAVLDFSLEPDRANAVMLYRSEIEAFESLIDTGDSLPTYDAHTPIEYFSSTANAVLANKETYIPTLAGFERNLQLVANVEYVAVVEELTETSPQAANPFSTNTAYSKGSFEGIVSVFHLASRAKLARTPLAATNSDTVSVRHFSDGSTDEQQAVAEDLDRNIGEAFEAAVLEVLPGTKFAKFE